ncbi:hypothetical protein RhiirA1_467012 [Rhizophagus irregularis]|uniref:Uncharacterized protein n=1 Tax=Rhizophagus irregularis TaxID=588596 RepID=A0A2I1FK13_9GLOM|nr:hypothetical protein RhiirA1_467012 [Rhizophagus irregularis]PKY34711.1 hypothetical protein RhiirB3_454691 [Rhizophagus irregularis]
MSTGFTELNVTNDPSFLYCTTSHFILCDKMDIKGNRTYDSNNIHSYEDDITPGLHRCNAELV